jgi:hypothetical protein
MEQRAWRNNFELRISNCETRDPPEGWESEGQFKLTTNEAKLIQFPADR